MWLRKRVARICLATALGVVVGLFLLKKLSFLKKPPIVAETEPFETPFEKLTLLGFYNDGKPRQTSDCEGRQYNTTIAVEQSFHLHDNLTQAVRSLWAYPKIQDDFQKMDLPFEEFVEKYWAELAGCGAWLPHHQVYFFVTRLMYYPTGVINWPTMSFLRARLFDKQWNHLDGYTIHWNGDDISFPRILDNPTTWVEGDSMMGAEDPRVVLEDGVEDAEPVVVFNMRSSDEIEKRRRMWIHRPFSNFSAPLAIRDEEPNLVEKNWAPFFSPRTPSTHVASDKLHLVYSLQPLRILICDLRSGQCDWVFKQEVPDELVHIHEGLHGEMRGGTNFVPISIENEPHTQVRLWAGFQRTHLDGGCGSARYRPELVVLANFGQQFHIVYASDAIDFGSAVLDQKARENPCSDGRILIPNGILHWNQQQEHDTIVISLSVGDQTIQLTRIRDVMKLIRSFLPMWEMQLDMETADTDELTRELRWSATANDVMSCSVESAMNSSFQDVQLAEQILNQSQSSEQAEVK